MSQIADGAAAVDLDQVHDLFVYLADQYHLHDVHGRCVRDPHAADKLGRDVQPLQQVADLRGDDKFNRHIGFDLFQYVGKIFHHDDGAGA